MKQLACGIVLGLGVYAFAVGVAALIAAEGELWAIELCNSVGFAWSIMGAFLATVGLMVWLFTSFDRD